MALCHPVQHRSCWCITSSLGFCNAPAPPPFVSEDAYLLTVEWGLVLITPPSLSGFLLVAHLSGSGVSFSSFVFFILSFLLNRQLLVWVYKSLPSGGSCFTVQFLHQVFSSCWHTVAFLSYGSRDHVFILFDQHPVASPYFALQICCPSWPVENKLFS